MIPEISVAPGTFIIFSHDMGWYTKMPDGTISSCTDPAYAAKFKNEYACVIVEGDDDDFICSLNPGFFTVVTDKFLVGRPNLLTFEHTIEWNAMSQVRWLAKQTGFFCGMATTHYNPAMERKKNK